MAKSPITPAAKSAKKTPQKTKKIKTNVSSPTETTQNIITPTTNITAAELIKTWFNGWKQTFNLKGRSSRFELWAFLLLNSILMVIIQLKCSYTMSDRFLRSAHSAGYSLSQIENRIIIAEIIFYLSIFIPLFPTVSLLVRRMHDLGKLAWANYFEPMFMSIVAMSLLFFTLLELEKTNYDSIALLLSICFITTFYGAGFYGLKTLITTMFYRGDTKDNEFGTAHYNDDEHETQALNLSCLYFLFILTIGTLYLAIAFI
ncbi:MAG: DUF805 domain-containing protein [Acetobacter sp.]|nr:DUF805 domain-containing protein [Acetobacter sp.]